MIWKEGVGRCVIATRDVKMLEVLISNRVFVVFYRNLSGRSFIGIRVLDNIRKGLTLYSLGLHYIWHSQLKNLQKKTKTLTVYIYPNFAPGF